jgi:hypothetical protein
LSQQSSQIKCNKNDTNTRGEGQKSELFSHATKFSTPIPLASIPGQLQQNYPNKKSSIPYSMELHITKCALVHKKDYLNILKHPTTELLRLKSWALYEVGPPEIWLLADSQTYSLKHYKQY